jgi:hypothetical protein
VTFSKGAHTVGVRKTNAQGVATLKVKAPKVAAYRVDTWDTASVLGAHKVLMK